MKGPHVSTLAIINPRKRRSGKRRSAKQRAATRKLVAFMRARRGGAKHRAAPHVNPRRRRSVTHHAKRVIRHFRRRMRRNPFRLPSFAGGAGAGKMVMCGVAGGAGAVTADLGMGLLQKFLPANIATPIALR